MVDFPTPPFADDTAITFFTSFIFRLSGNPRCIRGIVPVRGNPFSKLDKQKTDYRVAELTNGFSCCKQRSVENNRGFMFFFEDDLELLELS
jgi:hypothetical protein